MDGKERATAGWLGTPGGEEEPGPRTSTPSAVPDLAGAMGPGAAGTLVGSYLAEQCAALLDADRALGRGDETVVHGTRVAVRRFRSALRVFSALFEPRATAALDDELRWWGSTLGPVRDLQVLQDRLDALVTELDDEPLLAPAKRWIDEELRRDRLDHWAAVQEALGGERHAALLTVVARWAARPPWTQEALRTSSTLVPMVERATHSVAVRLRQADRSDDVDDLHRVRKAAKRARYAAEVVAPSTGKKARKEARKRAKKDELLQELLGEHRDSIVSAELLRRWGTSAATPRPLGFAFGMLHEREQQRTRAAREAVRRLGHRYR